ncbi:hypothetical protein GCM10022258_00910 [Aquimarina gracilis]
MFKKSYNKSGFMKDSFQFSIAIHLFIIVGSLSANLYSQNLDFTGTFKTQNNAITLQLKRVGNELHGTLQTKEALFAVKATNKNQDLQGIVYSDYGNYSFKATLVEKKLLVSFQGNTYHYHRVSEEHQLEGVDLTSYFKGGDQGEQQSSYNNSVYAEHISGGQLVVYERTSILISDDVRASSITYVNFCPYGKFTISSDSGFTVHGDRGGNASGASYGSNFGTWKVINNHNGAAVQLNFANGRQGVYPFNPQYLYAGRWRKGNTQYAFAKGKASCN